MCSQLENVEFFLTPAEWLLQYSRRNTALVLLNKHAEGLRWLCLFTNRAESGCEAVGHLGEMSKAQALASLLSCPLLEDLSEWSQWELIFKPQHDSLKEFIERNAGISGTSPTVGLASISSRIFLSFFFRLLFF